MPEPIIDLRLRTIGLIATAVVVFAIAIVAVYVSRIYREAAKILPYDYRPSAHAYSSAFTDALWVQVEHGGSVVIDTNVTVSSLLFAAVTLSPRTRSGFLLATVAARSRQLAAGVSETSQTDVGSNAIAVLREIIRADILMKRYDPDTLAAIYADTASFGGSITGLDAAATQLLGKPAALLTAAEAAFLVTLSWTTNRCDMGRLRKRSSELLASMRAARLLDPDAPFEAFVDIPALPAMALCQAPVAATE